MRTQRTLNLAWPLIILAAVLFTGSAVWGIGGYLFDNPSTNTIYSQKLANGTPGAGKYPRGGACPTGTSIDTSTGTTDRQCWSTIPASDIAGLPTVSGTKDYVAKFGTGGVVNSHIYEASDGSIAYSSIPLHVSGHVQSSGEVISGQSYGFRNLTYTLNAANPIWAFFDASDYGLSYYQDSGAHPAGISGDAICFHYGNKAAPPFCVQSAGNIFASQLTLSGLIGKGIGNVLYDYDGNGTIRAKALTAADLGINGGFDPLGTYFLSDSEGPCFLRWGSFSARAPETSAATCSTGSDALIAEFFAGEAYDFENRILWPGGTWLAKLNAKVNANGAAIRVEVWDTDGSGGYSQWFNWTTDAFTNTTFAVVQKQAQAAERIVASRAHRVFFRLYATCSTSTTVTLQYADGSSRIESPMAKEATPSIADVDGLTAALAGKEPALPAGKPGQGIGYLGTGTATGTTKGPIDLEPRTTGTPGQFVKFKGTGTATTVEKEGVTVSIPTPVTTRSFTVAASALNLGSGAVSGNVTSNVAIWTLRNAQSDFAYGAVITIPNDYVSGLAVSPLWYPISADANTAHTVKWAIGHMSMADAAGFTLTYTSWTGKACGAACPATYVLVAETAFGFGSYSAGNVVAIGIKRLGSDAADTYTGDLALAGLKFTYTSSL